MVGLLKKQLKLLKILWKQKKNIFKLDVLRHLRDFAENYKEELEQYRAIGTVEECCVAVERMKPKKPRDISRVSDGEGYVGLIGNCPCCDSFVSDDYFTCEDCFQVIDWSE